MAKTPTEYPNMDATSQKVFDEILKKRISELTVDDKAFLRARRSYLKESQLKEYDEVLNPPESKVKAAPAQEETDNPPVYVSKKDQKDQTSEQSEPVNNENGA